MKSTPNSSAAAAPKATSNTQLPFRQRNYVLLAIGMALIALGYWLMAGEKFIDATKFSMALYVCPILILGGFGWIIYAIMWRPKTVNG